MQSYRNRKVLIFGLGLNQGGVGSAKFFASHGAQIRVTDLKDKSILKPSIKQLKDFPEITYTLGGHQFEDIDWADLIIKNPAVRPGNEFMEYATRIGKKVEMDMGVFLQFVKPDQIIGVTGTKGKSTTSSIIYEVLKAGGKDVILAGNIGKSVLDIITFMQNSTIPLFESEPFGPIPQSRRPRRWKAKIKDKLIVLEVSSFQLESFDQHKVSPKWAVITNITPDHLNYYQSMDEYVIAKKIIGKYQTKDDFMFIRKDDSITDQSNFLKGLQAKIIRFSKNDLLASPSGGPKDFHPHLMGKHNLENMAAALAVARTFDINIAIATKMIQNFKGIPFRMELIKTWNGVKIYNDTTATSPEAGIQAITTLRSHIESGNTDGGLILIAGGMNKGMDYTEYATVVHKFVNKVYFLEGDSTNSIISSLRAQRSNLEINGVYRDLERLLTDVKKIVRSGDIILFSPAATSFNLFQNEFNRGRKFNQAVQKVFG